MAPPIQRHKVRDIETRLMRAGFGAPLLFLHSAGGFPVWTPFFDKLAARYDVIIPEHPGFGDTAGPAWIRNIGDMAMYYLDFLDMLGVGKVHLVGHSLGGWTAAEVAIRNCGHLKDLTLIAPAGLRVKGVPSGDNFIWSAEESVRNMFHNQKIADAILAMPQSEEDMDRALANRFMAARMGWEPRWHNPALARWLHRVTVPTQIIWGANDKLFPSVYAEPWKQGIPDARVEIIPECGHAVTADKGDACAATILSFLAGR
jgi:pimeloyl-ACP methyl ester carboxylesterase